MLTSVQHDLFVRQGFVYLPFRWIYSGPAV